MKKLSLATMILALAAIQMDFALIEGAGNMTTLEGADPESVAGLARGNFFRLFDLAPVWSSLPAFPRMSSLFKIEAMMMIGLMAFSIFYLMRIKWRFSLLWVAWACSLSWLAPFALNLLALRGNQDLTRVGGWLALTLISIFYSMLACFVFAGLQWRASKKRAMALMPEPAVSAAGSGIIEYPL